MEENPKKNFLADVHEQRLASLPSSAPPILLNLKPLNNSSKYQKKKPIETRSKETPLDNNTSNKKTSNSEKKSSFISGYTEVILDEDYEVEKIKEVPQKKKKNAEKPENDFDDSWMRNKPRNRRKAEKKRKKAINSMRELHRERWKRTRQHEPISTTKIPKIFKKKKNEIPKKEKKQEKKSDEKDEVKKGSKMMTLKNFVLTPEKIGKECLRLTNIFRKKHGKSELKWHDGIYEIAMEHSKNMGDDKVEFSHKGFDDRVYKMQKLMACASSAENLAYSSPCVDVAEVAVNSWIKSPGHRKNLLSDQNLCAIAPYKNKRGMWYFTQLFAKLYGIGNVCLLM